MQHASPVRREAGNRLDCCLLQEERHPPTPPCAPSAEGDHDGGVLRRTQAGDEQAMQGVPRIPDEALSHHEGLLPAQRGARDGAGLRHHASQAKEGGQGQAGLAGLSGSAGGGEGRGGDATRLSKAWRALLARRGRVLKIPYLAQSVTMCHPRV